MILKALLRIPFFIVLLCFFDIAAKTRILFYSVGVGEQAIVLQSDEIIGDVKDAGLYIKIPILQKVDILNIWEVRDWKGAAQFVKTSDHGNLTIVPVVEWNLINYKKFYEAEKQSNLIANQIKNTIDLYIKAIKSIYPR